MTKEQKLAAENKRLKAENELLKRNSEMLGNPIEEMDYFREARGKLAQVVPVLARCKSVPLFHTSLLRIISALDLVLSDMEISKAEALLANDRVGEDC